MNILLPVDGSALSLHETRFALRLVREGLAARFVLANVQEPATFYELITASSAAAIRGAAQGAGEDLIAPSAALLAEAGVPFETAVVTGDPLRALLDLVAERGCDLVLMGSRALGPIQRLVEGASLSRRLLHESPVPVLLIKPPSEAEPGAGEAGAAD